MRMSTLIGLLICPGIIHAQKAELIIPRGHTTPVTLLDYHEKEMWLASSQGDNSLTIWNFETETELRQLRNHNEAITSLKFHPRFPFILSADASGRLIVTDIVKNRKRSDIKLHESRINQILIPGEGNYFITCSNDGKVIKTGYVNLELIEAYECGQRITAIEKTSVGGDIFAGTHSGELILLLNGELKSRIQITKGSPVQRIHEKGKELIIVCENGEIQKLNIADMRVEARLNTGLKIKDSEWLNDSELIVTGRGENEVQIVNTGKMESRNLSGKINLQKNLDPFNIAPQQVLAIQDSGLILISDYDYSILAFDQESEQIIRRFRGLTERIREMKVHPNGKTLALASSVNGLRLYDLSEIYPSEILEYTEPSYSIDFSTLGTKMAVAHESKLRVYDYTSRKLIREFDLKGEYPNGNTSFINETLFAKKDVKDGISIFDISTSESELLKVKEGYRFRALPSKGLFAIQSGDSKLFLYSGGGMKKTGKLKIEDIIDFDFLENGELVVLNKRVQPEMSVFDSKGKKRSTFIPSSGFKANKIQRIPGTNYIITWNTAVKKGGLKSDFRLEVWDLENKDGIAVLSGASSVITSVAWSDHAKLVLASSEDGSVRAWPIHKSHAAFQFPVSLFPLEGKELVTITENGVYDATRSAMQLLHYVQGKDYITLDQLKEEYYEPHLLSKVFGFNEEAVRSRNPRTQFDLYPEIRLQHPNTNGGILGVDLQERGGGIGDVLIWINGKKAMQFDPEEMEKEHLKFEVAGHPYLKPNEINTISVRARNAEGNLISRAKTLRYIWSQDQKDQQSKMYALIVGVSDYQGNQLDLQFASKDATDISSALNRGAAKYFGVDNVEMITLNSDAGDKNLRPSKENIVEQMRLLSGRINPDDVFLFYFAGHGMRGKEEDERYYLITEEASKNDTRAMEQTERFSVSDDELAEMLGDIRSNNMIMILDACHSGEMINRFNRGLGHMGTEEVRALEKLMDETGIYILAGSESDDVSYETSLYGQGLLTYSLLFGMKGEALRDGEYLDVTRLFQFAAGKVPELASTVGGVQRPEVKIPGRAGQIDIGRYGSNEKASINLISPRPIILSPSFQEENLYLDIQNIGLQLDQKMREIGKGNDMPFIFLNSGNFSGAYEIRGRYLENSGMYQLTARIFRGTDLVQEVSFEDKVVDTLLENTAQKCLQIIESDFKSD